MSESALEVQSPSWRQSASQRLRATASSRLGKFLVVGGIAYVVNQIALFALYEFAFASMPPLGPIDMRLLISSIVAVEIAIIARFVLNDSWTFREHRDMPLGRRFLRSNLVSWGSPLIALATVNILTPVFGINYLIANSIGILLGLTWNWVGSTRLVWRPHAASIDQ